MISCKTDKISSNEVLFNNKTFLYKNRTIWIPECIKNGILRVKDVIIDGRVMNLSEFRQQYPNMKNVVFSHNIIYNAINKYEGRIETHVSFNQNMYFMGKVVGKIGRKGFLKLLKHKEESHIIAFWKRKLGVDIDKEHWVAGMQATKEIRLQELHWKVMSNIYPTNKMLYKMKVKNTNECDFCGCEDYIEHVFVHCQKIQSLWIEIEKQLSIILNKTVKLTICDN